MDCSGCREVECIPGEASGAWLGKDSRVPADAVVASAMDAFAPEEIITEPFEGYHDAGPSRSRLQRGA